MFEGLSQSPSAHKGPSSGSEKLLERGLFKDVHFIDILENLEIPQREIGKQRRIRPFSRNLRETLEILEILEIRAKTPFIVTPSSIPDKCEQTLSPGLPQGSSI